MAKLHESAVLKLTPRFPKTSRAYPGCKAHFKHTEFDPDSVRIVRRGYFYRTSDRRLIQRFQCRACFRHFSAATRSECFLQKKRSVNHDLYRLLCSGVSERRAALILGVDRRTVVRKSMFLGAGAKKTSFKAPLFIPPRRAVLMARKACI